MAHTIFETLKKAQKLITSGKLEKADSLCKKILKQNKMQVDALNLSGYIALQQEQYTRAIDIYEKTIAINANVPGYYYNLGLAHLRALHYDDAVTYLQRTIDLQPDFSAAYSDLCLALAKAGKAEVAIKIGNIALKRLPENAAVHSNLALAYDAWKDFDTSFEHYMKAAKLLPDRASVQCDLGNVYVGRGELDEARECFRKVIQLEPDEVSAYGTLTRITKYGSAEHEDVIQLKRVLNQSKLQDDERTAILFALGKIYQDCKLYDDAFDYFQRGNQLQDNKHRFEPEKLRQTVSSLLHSCTAELFGQKHSIGHTTQTPVFIIGTPRSGTTLTEQILSSHPDIFGAGELSWVSEAANNLQGFLKTETAYPDCLYELNADSAKELSLKYLNYINSLANGESRIIDKMPGNFMHLGLIHCLFPDAKIIHCRREPRDACISMFCNYFPSSVQYSYDLYKLGAFYNQYERIMEHWHKVLPPNTLIDVSYENLVQNQETESRRLIDFIGMDWHDDCLTFYKQKRRVHTASDTQVTKPIYSSAVSRWKHYEKHLQPLEDGFNFLPATVRKKETGEP